MIPELAIRYDDKLRPVAAHCSSCGLQMPVPPSDLHDSADVINWFSDRFIEHRKQKHPVPSYGRRSRSEPT